jgi:histone H3/H4
VNELPQLPLLPPPTDTQTTDLLLRRRPFSRLVREVCQDVGGGDKRWKASALEALQEAAEAFVIGMLNDGQAAAEHAKRWVVQSHRAIEGILMQGNKGLQFVGLCPSHDSDKLVHSRVLGPDLCILYPNGMVQSDLGHDCKGVCVVMTAVWCNQRCSSSLTVPMASLYHYSRTCINATISCASSC